MRGELGRDLAGSAEGGLVQRVEILADRAWRICRVDPRCIPVVLRCGVLFVRIRLYQARVDGHTLAAHQTFLDTTRHRRLEQMTQQLAVAKTPMAVLGKRRMIRDTIAQLKAAEPPVCQVQVDLLTEPPLGSDAKTIADKQHPDQQLRIDGRATGVAVELGQMSADTAQVDEPINRPQKVLLWNVILQRELVKQRRLCFLSRSHHRAILPPDRRIESAISAPIKQEFFNRIRPLTQIWREPLDVLPPKTEETSASITIATKEVFHAHQTADVAGRARQNDPSEIRGRRERAAGSGPAADRFGVVTGDRTQTRRGGRHPS